jgi:hypothetical protein
MEYTIIESNDITEMSDKVNKRLANGWKIVGSHQVIIRHWGDHESCMYSQTMIKEKDFVKDIL